MAVKAGIPHIDEDGLKKFNKDKKLIKFCILKPNNTYEYSSIRVIRGNCFYDGQTSLIIMARYIFRMVTFI